MSRSLPRAATRVVFAVLLSVTVTLLALELVFRTVMVDPVLPWSPETFQERIAVDWPHPVEIEPSRDSFRIVALGDSFGRAGGHGNFNYLLERRLRRRWPTVELVNLSVPALELHDELELWTRFGAHYRPDLVLHSVFVGNDLLMPEGELVEYRGIAMRRTWGLASWSPRRWLLKLWWDRRIIWRDQQDRAKGPVAYQPGRGARILTASVSALPQAEGTFSEQEFLRIERQRLEVVGKTSEWKARRAEALEILGDISGSVEGADATYVVVLHPDQFQVEESVRRRISAAYDLNVEADFDLDLAQRQILEHCAEHGIPCLDLLPAFREAGAKGGLYLLRDTHYGPKGNRLAARLIAAFLQHEGLSP